MNDHDREQHLLKVYSAKNNRELAECYNEWAKCYDKDLLSFGYTIPALLSGMVGRYVRPQDGPILDAGAGTGLMGEILALLGYKDMVALDISQGMLEAARRKNVYRELRQTALGEPLDFPDNAFNATVVAGVFTTHHAPPDSLDELLRITKSTGYILFSNKLDVYLEGGFKEKLEALEKEGIWSLIEMTEEFQSLPFQKVSDTTNRIFVFRVS